MTEYQMKLYNTPLSSWPTLQLMNMAKNSLFYYNPETLHHVWPYVIELNNRGYIVGWRQGIIDDYVIGIAKAGSDKARYLIPVKAPLTSI